MMNLKEDYEMLYNIFDINRPLLSDDIKIEAKSTSDALVKYLKLDTNKYKVKQFKNSGRFVVNTDKPNTRRFCYDIIKL